MSMTKRQKAALVSMVLKALRKLSYNRLGELGVNGQTCIKIKRKLPINFRDATVLRLAKELCLALPWH